MLGAGGGQHVLGVSGGGAINLSCMFGDGLCNIISLVLDSATSYAFSGLYCTVQMILS